MRFERIVVVHTEFVWLGHHCWLWMMRRQWRCSRRTVRWDISMIHGWQVVVIGRRTMRLHILSKIRGRRLFAVRIVEIRWVWRSIAVRLVIVAVRLFVTLIVKWWMMNWTGREFFLLLTAERRVQILARSRHRTSRRFGWVVHRKIVLGAERGRWVDRLSGSSLLLSFFVL